MSTLLEHEYSNNGENKTSYSKFIYKKKQKLKNDFLESVYNKNNENNSNIGEMESQ